MPGRRCQTPDNPVEGGLVSIASVDTYYLLVMDWDPTANTLTFAVDTNRPVTADLAASGFPAISRLPQNPFAGCFGGLFSWTSSIDKDYRIGGKLDNLECLFPQLR